MSESPVLAAASTTSGCLLCGNPERCVAVRGPDFEYGAQPGEFTLVSCSRCGHVYLDPLPAIEEVAALYPPTYYTVNADSPLYLQGYVYEQKIARDTRRIVRFLDRSRTRSIVDIGCGDAQRLVALRGLLGAQVELIGVDLQISPVAAEQARAANVRLIDGNVEGNLTELRDAGHDFIMMCQLIEHLRDPRQALLDVRRKLSPGGRLLVETPHRGGWDFRLFRRRYWGGYHLPRHFHIFSQESLALLARQTGLVVLKQGSLPSPGFWIMSLRNQCGLSSACRGPSWLETLNFSNLPIVAAFTALDLAWSAIGGRTSTQYLLSVAPESQCATSTTPSAVR